MPASSTTQTRKEQTVLRNEPWHGLSHSKRPWSGFAHRTSHSAHTQTHAGSCNRGLEKLRATAEEMGGTRQHLQSPLLIALLPAWSQITGLEMLQSGLYLLASLPHPQIHTSKPPSYHLLVNLHQPKRTPWYSAVKLLLYVPFLLRGHLPLGGSLHPLQSFSGLGKVWGDVFVFSSPSSPWVATLMWED